jgi:putative CocE/NonD family hydrolase
VAGCDRFLYDPQDPVPTIGGAIWPFSPLRLKPGQSDQSAVEERGDVLVYSGDPLPEDLTVVGPLEVELWAATSARDTDFTAKLVDVDPSGAARVVQDGVIRGRFHADPAQEGLLELHRPYRFAIDLQAVAYTFRAGHLLRLEISSSNFPKFDRNLNTAADAFSGTASMVARQTVFHGGEMASRLRLPVLPPSALEALRWHPGTA